jgi:hypothetical protein
MGPGAIFDLIFAAYEAMKLTASMIEQEIRAELIREYINANEKRVNEALDYLVNERKGLSPRTLPTLDLQKSVNDRMRFHLVTAILNVSESRSSKNSSLQRETAELAAKNIALFNSLSTLDVNEDLLAPMVRVQKKFIEAAKSETGNFDDFMESMASLRTTRDKWVDARDKYRALSD